jgi:hypothetical protein
MVSIPNKLYYGFCYNFKNSNSHFRYFSVVTVRNKSDGDGVYYTDTIMDKEEYLTYDRNLYGEPFYQVFGSFKIDLPQTGMVITETDDLSRAITIAESLTGEKIIDGKI